MKENSVIILVIAALIIIYSLFKYKENDYFNKLKGKYYKNDNFNLVIDYIRTNVFKIVHDKIDRYMIWSIVVDHFFRKYTEEEIMFFLSSKEARDELNKIINIQIKKTIDFAPNCYKYSKKRYKYINNI